MSPSFDPSQVLSDTIQQAKDRAGSAFVWVLGITAVLAVVAFSSGRRRR
jgi:hypothetical protein